MDYNFLEWAGIVGISYFVGLGVWYGFVRLWVWMSIRTMRAAKIEKFVEAILSHAETTKEDQ